MLGAIALIIISIGIALAISKKYRRPGVITVVTGIFIGLISRFF